MDRRNDDDAQSYRAEIDAASFDGIAAHFRESAEGLMSLRGDSINADIAEAVSAADAASRDTLRSASRTFQEIADELRRQHGI
ncbi:hypothetical protein C5U48_20725 [Mycolicibacter virginiensis]|uniref:Uncharacterized protein n=1 Tax=Mycolicibacter virginiensis TaxID=1795032 RepID=A0A9X7NWV8_9MYCO|nr:hypothetical protein [Mycolicibacter virginiensis]PQM50306.1 hypothetical protein C5U48_20725 [Mycolicibacter virginiensis]